MQPAHNKPSELPPGHIIRLLKPMHGLPAGALLRHLGNTRKPIGASDVETGRPIIQASENPEVNQAKATAEHGSVKKQVAEAIKPIKGAAMAGARAEKDSERLEEKIDEEGQSARTVRDYSGMRISVDTAKAAEEVAAALRRHFQVYAEQDEFAEGSKETSFHAHTLNIRMPGSDVSHEVQILPREVAEDANAEHGLYEKARDGDAQASAKLKAQNEANYKAFEARNGEGKGEDADELGGVGGASSTPASEPKYKHGNTQANIPSDSPAAKALDKLRTSIPKEHLAGDGKDIGDGGNHVTVRYGIQGDDTEGIRKYIQSRAPFEAKLGKTGVFPPTVNSKGAAVVHAKIESPELTKMNDEIQQHGDFAPSDFKDYQPHATLAYMHPDHAEAYKGRSDVSGASFPVRSIHISDRHGNQTEVQMKGTPVEKPRTGPLAKGDVVKLKDGTAGVVQHFQPPVNGSPARVRVRLADGGRRSNMRPGELTRVPSAVAKEGEKWIGVDVDGTLAHYDTFKGHEDIGQPIEPMIERVKQMIAEGKDVRIFTARIADDPTGIAKASIEAWSLQHLGKVLPVTNVKDPNMEKLFDDRAVQVGRNRGNIVGGEAAVDAAGEHGNGGEDTRGGRTRPADPRLRTVPRG